MQAGVRFISGNKIAVPYEFDSSGMNQGDVLKGNFMIVSSFGEYILPFAVSISHEVIESSIGSIRNLFHFTNLAKSDWDEAVRVFYSSGFIDIMTGTDASYRNLYMGLTSGGNKNHNLEEFLIGINKKKIITSIASATIMLYNFLLIITSFRVYRPPAYQKTSKSREL